jgi:uncharacterized protein
MEKIAVPLEVKTLKDRELEGFGAVFRNRDLGGDIIIPGAFSKTLSEKSLRPMLWMHKPDQVIGRWDVMREDRDGLFVKGVLANTDLGNEVHTLLKMEAVRGLSIGYQTKDYSYDKTGARLLKEVELYECSVVSMPMNPLAQVAHVKSQLSAAGEYVPTGREFERILRDVGCSKTVARRLVALFRNYDESGVTPDDSQVVPDSDAAKALAALAEEVTANSIRLRFGT